MATTSEFWQAYRHPRWQVKRAAIFARANGKCEECGDGETTLNVHHTYYKKDAKPWEYEDSELQCLCEDCHELKSAFVQYFKEAAGKNNENANFSLYGHSLAQIADAKMMNSEQFQVSIQSLAIKSFLRYFFCKLELVISDGTYCVPHFFGNPGDESFTFKRFDLEIVGLMTRSSRDDKVERFTKYGYQYKGEIYESPLDMYKSGVEDDFGE